MRNSEVHTLVTNIAKAAAANVQATLAELAAEGVLTEAQVLAFRAKYLTVTTRAASA